MKIQTVGIGGYIRDPRGRHGVDSRGMNIRVMKVIANDGNSFRCYAVKAVRSGEATVDWTDYISVPLDTDVKQAFI